MTTAHRQPPQILLNDLSEDFSLIFTDQHSTQPAAKKLPKVPPTINVFSPRTPSSRSASRARAVMPMRKSVISVQTFSRPRPPIFRNSTAERGRQRQLNHRDLEGILYLQELEQKEGLRVVKPVGAKMRKIWRRRGEGC